MTIQGNPVQALDPYSEALASAGEVPRKRHAGDGTEPGGTGRSLTGDPKSAQSVPADQRPPNTHLAPIGTTLLEADAATIFRTVELLVRSQDRLAKNRWAIDLHFDLTRSGVLFSRLEKVPNQSAWVQKLPDGMGRQSTGAVPNTADDLCNKVVDTLMADPAKLIAKPRTTDETMRQAGELATKFLAQDGGPTGTNDNECFRWALDNALARSASFLHYRVDPSGGGYQPLQKLAHPMAQDPAHPLVAMIPVPNAPPDPLTGQPPMMEDVCVNPVLRYVSPENQFVKSPDEADRVWLPRIVIRRLRREQVRCFPITATAEQAAAIVLLDWMTLAEARAMWPDTVGQMSQEQLQTLATWRPAMSEQIVVPAAFRGLADGQSGPSVDEVGSFAPLLQRRMFYYRFYVTSSPEYPAGAVVDVTGAVGGTGTGHVLGQRTLEYAVTLPKGGTEQRCRDIPVVQIRPMQDISGGDPMGWPFISRFAGASEADATLVAAFQDACDNILHPHVYIRSTAAVDEDDWNDRTTPIILNPQDPEPTYEHFPNLPPILQLHESMQTAMQNASGLRGSAVNLDSSNAVSGVAKNIEVQRALVALSGFQANLHAGIVRGGRIKCQLAQAEFTTPMLIEDTGEAGSSEVEYWTGADFAGIEDTLGIQPGTGTMMTPEGRAQYTAYLQGQQWISPDLAADIALPGIKQDLGLPDDPAEDALEREIGAWLKGPPKGWDEAYGVYSQQLQAYQAQQQAMQQAALQQQAQQVQGQQEQAVHQQNDHQLKVEQVKHPPAPPAPDHGPAIKELHGKMDQMHQLFQQIAQHQGAPV